MRKITEAAEPTKVDGLESTSATERHGSRRADLAAVARRATRSPEFGSAVAVVLIYIFFSIAAAGNGFVTWVGTASWLDTASELGIIAIPVGLLMISGEFDLSIGSMVGAGSITVGIVSGHYGYSVWVAALIGLTVAVAVGLGNGILVTRTGLPSFIVSLGANLIVAGLALTIARSLAGTTTLTVNSSGLGHELFAHRWGQFDISIMWWAGLALGAAWLLSKSRYGPWILATGGNADQARRAGVLTARVKICLFIATAVAATFVGMMQAVEYNTGDAVGGQGYVFQAPIVVVIGGVLLTGGFGSMLGVVFGTLIYGIIGAGLFYTGWNTDLVQVFLGMLLLVAVLTNNQLRRLALSATTSRGGSAK